MRDTRSGQAAIGKIPPLNLVQKELMGRDLRRFAKEAWVHGPVDPAPLVWGWSQDAMCDHLQAVSVGDIRFLMINIGPRLMKSSLCSVIWPAWNWILEPHLQFLTGSYALQLATRDSVRTRRLIESPWYQSMWGDRFAMLGDDNQKRTYVNDKGGRRITVATEAGTTGEGGNRLIVDDPHNAVDVESDAIRTGTHEWWDHAMQNRMNQQNKDSWMIIGQRTDPDDLFGHIEKTTDMKSVVRLVLPNEFDASSRCITYAPSDLKRPIFRDPRTKAGELIMPERIDAESTARLKAAMGAKYQLQYNQDPRAGDMGLFKRAYWKKWESADPPDCVEILSIYDTAFEENESADESACTDWGVFKMNQRKVNADTGETYLGSEELCIILIGAWHDRVAFHALKKKVKQRRKIFKPDHLLIEKKASGTSLIQEMRRDKIRVKAVRLDHGGRVKIDKFTRAELAVLPLQEGRVYYMDRAWAQEVIEQCANNPGGSQDDIFDTVMMAMVWLRRRYEIGDWEEFDETTDSVRLFKRKKRAIYG